MLIFYFATYLFIICHVGNRFDYNSQIFLIKLYQWYISVPQNLVLNNNFSPKLKKGHPKCNDITMQASCMPACIILKPPALSLLKQE
jgi:hypothetical protein